MTVMRIANNTHGTQPAAECGPPLPAHKGWPDGRQDRDTIAPSPPQ